MKIIWKKLSTGLEKQFQNKLNSEREKSHFEKYNNFKLKTERENDAAPSVKNSLTESKVKVLELNNNIKNLNEKISEIDKFIREDSLKKN